MCARPCAARTCFFELIATQKRAQRAPPPLPIAASLLLIRPPKIYKIYRTWAVPAPAPLIVASLILPAIFCGQNYVPVRPVFFFFIRSWIFSFCNSLLFSSLLFISFLFIFSYPSLLISSYSSRRYYSSSFYSFLFLYFNLFVVLHT